MKKETECEMCNKNFIPPPALEKRWNKEIWSYYTCEDCLKKLENICKVCGEEIENEDEEMNGVHDDCIIEEEEE